MESALLSLVVYVPESHLNAVKTALFTAGGGTIGHYDQCCWQTEGTGQFRPLAGSDPFLGARGKLEQVKEWRVEMVCAREKAPPVLAALKKAHPYETPAFHFVETLRV